MRFNSCANGFRPGRKQHDALDALYVGITRRKVNYVNALSTLAPLDLDIRSFFDKVEQCTFNSCANGHMEKFVRHRIGDERIVRLILKWTKAGVMEDGQWHETEEGTPGARVESALPALRTRCLGERMAEEGGARRYNRGAVRR